MLAKAVVIAPLAALAFVALLATALRQRSFTAKAAAAALTAAWTMALARVLGATVLPAAGIAAVTAVFLLRRGRFAPLGRNPGLGGPLDRPRG